MKAKIERDRQKRRLFASYESLRRSLKAQLCQPLTTKQKNQIRRRLEKIPRNSSRTRLQNRCTLTGRARSVYRLFKVSRIQLRRAGRAAKIPGLRKASW